MSNHHDEKEEEDPFACFGDEDEENDDDQQNYDKNARMTVETTKPNSSHQHARDPSCGILTFHSGTEQSLLQYVRLELATISKDREKQQVQSNDDAQLVLQLVDNFCFNRHWMMHVGNEKGIIIQQFVEQCYRSYFYETNKNECNSSNFSHENSNNHKQHTTKRPFIMVELGTYCGYSSILLSKTVRDYLKKHSNSNGSSINASNASSAYHLFTIEVVEQNVQIAREIIKLAGLENQISVLYLKPGVSVVDLIRASINKYLHNVAASATNTNTNDSSDDTGSFSSTAIDFLFLDHDKSYYLTDLKQLEQARLILSNTYVAADNVIFAQIDNYRQYVSSLMIKHQIVQTQLKECQLEYSSLEDVKSSTVEYDTAESTRKAKSSSQEQDPEHLLRDGIELTIYLKDPISF